ncbi:L,D-transpeptidase family protein [Nakamurella sp. YIM 132087]|uniref:L,D-transpeptidase family protein n=1 Tax=Nakamurella alba TaxID=2665158 RepID=A0A7K1FTI4_9ACTN|nr:Ig-like domain repeat protein [Nakamurella alba]MTD16699.1 L,D-transpeptidase family protein [Nakamurella alba]
MRPWGRRIATALTLVLAAGTPLVVAGSAQAATAATGAASVSSVPAPQVAAAGIATTTTLTIDPNQRAYSGGGSVADIWVKSANGQIPGGELLVWEGSTLRARGMVNGSGHARLALPRNMTVGNHRLQARFWPVSTSGYTTSLSAPAILSISRDRTGVGISGSAAVTVGTTARLDLSVAAATRPGTGSVDVLLDGKKVATRQLNPYGRTWYMIPTNLSAGNHQLIVHYSGSSILGAANAGRVITVSKVAPTVQSVTSETSVGAGARPLFTVAVSGAAPVPTGTVKVLLDGRTVATKTLTGRAFTVQLPALSAGIHTVIAAYSGDSRFVAANATTKTITAHAPNPCPATAKACVDLTNDQSWLQSGGRITYGPVPITSGRPGYRTYPGTFPVYWKHKDHYSSEFAGAPMPNSVFFDGGIAFHAGSLTVWSHGCIHLSYEASEVYFNTLQEGDDVYVFGYAPYA